MDGRQIKDMLNDRAQEVCEMLLPGGKVEKNEYVIGDVRGTPGTSLKVVIQGPKTGVFCDFADKDVKGNNLLELWLRVRGCSFREAIQEAKSFLGIRDDSWQRVQGNQSQNAATRSKGRKRLEDELTPLVEGSAVWRWLTETRGIGPDTLRRYRIGEAFIKKGERQCVVFPFFDAQGNIVRLKFRDIADKKYMFLHPKSSDATQYVHGAAALHLFGIQGVPDDTGMVVITEGEIDALSFAEWGYPAVSVPIGAQAGDTPERCSHDEWIANDYDWLEAFETITLAMDDDEPGRQATNLLIPRLGRERVAVVDYPAGCKDANSCVTQGHGIDSLIEHAHDLDPTELKKPDAFRDEVWLRFYPVDGVEPGDDLPWAKATPDGKPIPFKFRESEVTVWHGYNGHGKTIALNHCLIDFASKGRKSCIASLEMPPGMTLQNMVRQAIAKRRPETRPEFDRAMDWLDQWVWVYDFVGSAYSESVLECWEYAARKYGINHFVLDSLMKLQDVPGSDYDAQKRVMNLLNDFAKRHRVHVHLVAHSKKPDSKHPKEKRWPGELDISGSSDIPNGAWNVLCMWRNENKQNDLETAHQMLRTKSLSPEDREKFARSLDEIPSIHDALFIVQKQRTTGVFPLHRQLWFDHGEDGSWQFGCDPEFRIQAYVEHATAQA